MMTSHILLIILLVLHIVSRGTANVFTSSVKMAELAATENAVLQAVTSSNINEDVLKKFTQSRHDVKRSLVEDEAGHPNAAYLLIKAFVTFWIRQGETREIANILSDDKTTLPTESDLSGSKAAILRLERVYNLSASDILAGNYRGYQGPPLSPLDAYEIGRQAFTDGMLEQSERWLRLSVAEMNKDINRNVGTLEPVSSDVTSGQESGFTPLQRAGVLAVLGRVLAFKGKTDEARELYQASVAVYPNHGDVSQLAIELEQFQSAQNVEEADMLPTTLSQLCSRPKNHTLGVTRPHHVCRYKPSLFIPYLRYKEEILSLQPYVSLFYDVIHDFEIERLITFGKSQLIRASVEGDVHSNRRTSDLGWISDMQEVTAARLSVRITDVTGLDVKDRQPDGPSSGEPFQLVNYGLGGHYSAHFDILKSSQTDYLSESGERIATFLLYLSDVDIGGHTVFVDAGISVAPVKGMALFWYNTNPALAEEPLTLHAGCPVLKGHKWIANKWIWTYGNMYRHPCGPSPNSTHLQVERIVNTLRHNIHAPH